jgi:hypothetical protein
MLSVGCCGRLQQHRRYGILVEKTQHHIGGCIRLMYCIESVQDAYSAFYYLFSLWFTINCSCLPQSTPGYMLVGGSTCCLWAAAAACSSTGNLGCIFFGGFEH